MFQSNSIRVGTVMEFETNKVICSQNDSVTVLVNQWSTNFSKTVLIIPNTFKCAQKVRCLTLSLKTERPCVTFSYLVVLNLEKFTFA